MVEYTIDDIRGPTVAREMAQLKEFVLAQFNGAIADAETAAAAAATAAANAVLANTVKKTGEASQSIAGDVAITGALDAAAIGSGTTPIVCGDLTAYGNVSLDDTVLQGNLTGADPSALINLAGVGSVFVPNTSTGTYNTDAANAKRVKDELDGYTPMVRTTGRVVRTGELIQSAGANGDCYTVRATNINYSEGAPASNMNSPILKFVDTNDSWIAFLFARHKIDNTTDFNLWVRNSDGTTKIISLGSGNVI